MAAAACELLVLIHADNGVLGHPIVLFNVLNVNLPNAATTNGATVQLTRMEFDSGGACPAILMRGCR